jgi:hypothetical protein
MLLIPDHDGRHRLLGQDKPRRTPTWLRPTTWLLNAVVLTAVAYDIASLSYRLK